MYELVQLINNGEDSCTQFKENITRSESLAAEMVAFSNALGGKIIIGICKEDIDRLNQLISNTANQNVRPPIYPLTEIVVLDGKKVIVVNIKKGINRPYQTSSGFYYTKSGSDKRKMSNEELKRLFAESNSLFADEEVLLKTVFWDINSELFYQILEKINDSVFEDLKQKKLELKTILQNLDLMTDNNLTLAGNLLFGKNPQKFCKSFYVDCLYFDGNSISVDEYIHKERINGTFGEIYKYVMIFLQASLRKIQNKKEFNSIGQLEIAKESLSEIIINALVHRDYYINSSIKVFIFNNRVEIISPGKLPNSLTVEKIKNGISIHRNPILNSLTQYILPYSGLGSGIKRALKYCHNIEFENNIVSEEFKVIFKRSETSLI